MSSILIKMLQAAGNSVDQFPNDTSMDFNGSDSSIYNLSAGTDFGSGDFTLEAWIRPDNVSGYNAVLGQNYSTTGGALYILSGQLNYYQGGDLVFGGTISVNTWHHVAISRSGSILRGFLDGTLVDTGTPQTISDNDLYVGASDPGPNNVPSTEYFDGEIYRPRWSSIARYTSSFTPEQYYGVDADTVALVIYESGVVTEKAQSLSLTTANVSAGARP